MTEQLAVTIHEIAVDGLPDMEALVGRVAFIFDGCIVSGWPLDPVKMAREGIDVDSDIWWHADRKQWLWEGNDDVARLTKFGGITHWIEFPAPIWNITRNAIETPIGATA